MDERYLAHAFRDAKTIEFRQANHGKWAPHQFGSIESLRPYMGMLTEFGNIYTSLNRPAVLLPPDGKSFRYLSDTHIEKIVRLPFDFDPVRPTGAPSTDAEMAAAHDRRDKFVAFMSGQGWPMPALGSSGNGAHSLYRCLLPNDANTKAMLKTLYVGMKDEFSDESVLFDASVRSPAQIWRLYGTTNRKGESTAERPHRLATVWIPPRWDGVSPAQIKTLSESFLPKVRTTRLKQLAALPITGRGNYRTLDAVAWLKASGLYRFDMGAGKHSVVCPWDHEHSSTDGDDSTATVIWESTGDSFPTFCCRHAHCEDRTMRDVIGTVTNADQFCREEFRPTTKQGMPLGTHTGHSESICLASPSSVTSEVSE